MAEMSVAEMSTGRNVCGRNVLGQNVLAETSVAEMSVAEMSELIWVCTVYPDLSVRKLRVIIYCIFSEGTLIVEILLKKKKKKCLTISCFQISQHHNYTLYF